MAMPAWWTRRTRLVLALAVALLLAGLALWRIPARGGADDRTAAAPPAVLVDTAGERRVVLQPGVAERAGIGSEVLPASRYHAQLTAYGSVIDVGALAAARATLAAAQGAARRAAAETRAARLEAERKRELYADNRNSSLKALQAAEADYQAAEADSAAAASAEQAQAAVVREAWGPVVGDWTVSGSAALRRLLERKQVLILLSLPIGTALPRSPPSALLRVTGAPVTARFLSSAAHTDPRVQGVGLYYLAPAAESLLPGTSVEASLAVGPAVAVVRVPGSAVVWAAGSAWIYLRTDSSTYMRRRISTDEPTPEGYAVRGLPPGSRVVVRGAQLLLSEESVSRIPAGDND